MKAEANKTGADILLGARSVVQGSCKEIARASSSEHLEGRCLYDSTSTSTVCTTWMRQRGKECVCAESSGPLIAVGTRERGRDRDRAREGGRELQGR